MVESIDTSAHLAASFETAAAADDAVDDRLAVLRLADLEVSGLRGRLDEVARRSRC